MRTVKSEDNIIALIKADKWMMDVLEAAKFLNLPDWWVGAGFLRNKVWDSMEGIKSQPTKDVDLVYFNPEDIKPETDWRYDEYMKRKFPFAEWEVRNQARMHYVNNFEPYTSTADGIAHWVETATCVAVRLHDDEIKLLFCHGKDDLLNLVVRPIPLFRRPELIQTFHDRVEKKQWNKKWPHLKVRID